MFPLEASAAEVTLWRSIMLAESGDESPNTQQIPLGLLAYCFGLAQKARARVPHTPNFADPLVFIREAARIGANAVQIPFGICNHASARTIRDTAGQYKIALESTVALPKPNADTATFEAELETLQLLGVTIARTVVFPGRRYEDLHSYDDYENAENEARERIRRAEPIARRYKVRLAIENHKDQRIEERVAMFSEFESDFIGACLDVGNNISLLEDPVEVALALAPYALTVHFKDQGVGEYEDGFLLADVPLGQGCIDLQEVIRVIRAKNPNIHFQLELITRDPLKVPVLKQSYWGTFPEIRASELSRTWALVKGRGTRDPFPLVSSLSPSEQIALERRNIEESFRFASEHLTF